MATSSSQLRLRRRLTIASLIACVGAVLFIAGDLAVWGVSDRWIAARQSAWKERVDEGERLLAAGKTQEAIDHLRALDVRFPARHAKHALVRERERLLRLLATAEEKAGKRKRSRKSWERVAEFEGRNLLNHFGQAEALVRMGRGSDAIAPLERTLEIAPDHHGATSLLMDLQTEAARWQEVERLWLGYLDATRYERFDLHCGKATSFEWVLVDGNSRFIEFDLDCEGPAPAVVLDWPRGTIALERCELHRPRRAGQESPPAPLLLPLMRGAMEEETPGRFRPADAKEARLVFPAKGITKGPHRIRIRLRAFKDHSSRDRARARKAMRNLLHFELIEALEPRLAQPRRMER